MNDLPNLLPLPGQHLKPSARRKQRKSDESPTRGRLSDDILVHLSPLSAVDALNGPLKRCLGHASASEQAFAMRTAVASYKLQTWLDELMAWSWPSGGGAMGFETPRFDGQPAAGAADTTAGNAAAETQYIGSLLASELATYEARLDAIHAEMEDLDVEEIKTHVLHNHIMPLSRPGTPMSDSNRSSTTSSSLATSYNRMEDLTAIITAIVMQTLPNLSKLGRLMNVWSIRLSVLRGVPTLLSTIQDAEVALQSGWNAISSFEKKGDGPAVDPYGGQTERSTPLTDGEFEVMKLVLEKKVARPGQMLDYMLDSLEGLDDTLPDEWLDRMESVERGYGEWVASCERLLREAQWARLARERAAAKAKAEAELQQPELATAKALPARPELPSADKPAPTVSASTTSPERHHDVGVADVELEDAVQEERLNDAPVTTVQPPEPVSTVVSTGEQDLSSVQSAITADDVTIQSSAAGKPSSAHGQNDPAVANELPVVDETQGTVTLPVPIHLDLPSEQGQEESGSRSVPDSLEGAAPVKMDSRLLPSSLDAEVEAWSTTHDERDMGSPVVGKSIDAPEPDEIMVSIEEDDAVVDTRPSTPIPDMETEDELPAPAVKQRRNSEASESSTVIHDASVRFAGILDDTPGVPTSPELPRLRDLEDRSRGETPDFPSSPPVLKKRATSLSLSNRATPEPGSPFDTSFLDDDADFTPSEVGSPSKRPANGHTDDQLRQQISEILESIPANFKLSAEPSPVNLNPPGLDLPRPKKPAKDPIRRSASSLSSRASTPSFTLAPAYSKNPRPRHNRSNQEIKVYHLSRSTGEAPIKLFIRLVGEHGERVMVRVGGGWADLGEYLKEYASHHGRRSAGTEKAKVEIRDLPQISTARSAIGSSPPARPASALDYSPITPLNVRKARKSFSPNDELPAAGARPGPKNPAVGTAQGSDDTPSSGKSTRSRSSSRLSWDEEDSSLGLAGPTGKKKEMSEESRAWVESVKEKVRLASGERKISGTDGFGEMGKVGGTKRLFRKG